MNKIPSTRLFPLAAAFSCPLLLAALLPAQALATDIEEIIVSAQKRPQNIQDVPVAVSALSGLQLAEASISDVFDLQYSVPTLAVRQNQSATTSNFSIRGVGTSGSNFGLESSVGLYVDGVYRARQNSMINDMVDMARVEVLRGPQGTLFGRNTPSGAVLMSTVAPSHGFDGYVDVGLGNLDLKTINGAIGGSLVDEVLAYRLTGFGSSRDGYISDIELGKNSINDRDRNGGRLQFLYTPSETLSLRLIADYSRIEEICCGAVTVRNNYQVYGRDSLTGAFATAPGAGTDSILSLPEAIAIPGTPITGFGATVIDQGRVYDDVVAFNQLPKSKNKDRGLSLELNWDVLGGEFTAISAWRQFDSKDAVDGDFSAADIVSRQEDAEQDGFSQEVRFHIGREEYDLLLGAFYFSQQLDTQSTTTVGEDGNNVVALSVFSQAASLGQQAALAAQSGNLAGAAALQQAAYHTALTANGMVLGLENVPLPPDHPLYGLQQAGFFGVAFPVGAAGLNDMRQEHSSWAVFGQADYRLLPALTLTAGLRYTVENKDIDGSFSEPGASWGALLGLEDLTIINPRPNVDESLDDQQLTGTLKLGWLPNTDTLVYLSYATGYKSGGTNTDRINPAFNTIFDAETATTYEVGMKMDFPDQNVRVNLALHHSITEDYQTNAFQGTGFNLVNAGKVVARGGELETWWQATDGLSLSAAYSYNQAEFRGFEQANCWIAYSWLTGSQDPGRANPLDQYCNRSGGDLDTNPEHSVLFGATQVFAVGDGNELYLHGDYNYRSEQYMDTNLDPYKRQNGYGVVNARSGLRLASKGVEVALWARNLLDEDFLNVYYDVPLQAGKLNAYPSEPRTYGLDIRKDF